MRIIRVVVFSILLIFLIFASSKELLAKVDIIVPDTLIPRGNIYLIPITGSINENPIDKINLQFSFDSRIIDIKSVRGADGFAIQCQPPDFQPKFIKEDSATIDISCTNCQNIQNGTICILEIEGLVGPDSLTTLRPEKVLINGVELTPDTLKAGLINVPGDPIFQRFPEGLGQNYPNPFSDRTRFPFSIEKTTGVRFLIYSTNGTRLVSTGIHGELLKIIYYSESGTVPINDLNAKFEKGNYELILTPDIQFPCGAYFLVMKTDKGIYHKGFIYSK